MNRKTKVLVFRWIKPHHLIVLMVLCMTFAIFAGYAISVSDNHVAALFPYISDAGAKPPASCVFGLLLNIGGMFAFIIIYLRHIQYETFHATEIVRLYVINDIAMFLGFCAALGALFVANFQDVNVATMHVIGALVLFVVGNIYCWLQDYLSYKADASRCILYTRYTLTVISTLMFAVTTVGSSEAGKMLAKTNLTSWDNIMHYNKDMPGYNYHLVSTFSEWLMVFGFIGYFLTFYGEFKLFGTSLAITQNNYFLQQVEPVV